MIKEIVKVEKLFTDTDEGITKLYDKNGCELGVLLWTVDTEYGSSDCRLLTLGGTLWDETLMFGLSVKNWNGEGFFWVDDLNKEKGYCLKTEFSNLDEGERIATEYIRNTLNEDFFVAK